MAAKETRYAVLSAVGLDRIGIIATASDFLRRHEANMHSTFASRLGQVFILNVCFEVDHVGLERITAEYQHELSEFMPTLMEAPRPTAYRDPEALHYELTVNAYDHEGIVAELARLMAMHRTDIVKLAGCTYPAPLIGLPLFVTEMKLDVPNAIAVRNIRKALHELEQQCGWDIDFRPEPRAELEVSQPSMYPPSRWMRHQILVNQWNKEGMEN